MRDAAARMRTLRRAAQAGAEAVRRATSAVRPPRVLLR